LYVGGLTLCDYSCVAEKNLRYSSSDLSKTILVRVVESSASVILCYILAIGRFVDVLVSLKESATVLIIGDLGRLKWVVVVIGDSGRPKSVVVRVSFLLMGQPIVAQALLVLSFLSP
jgi:hypothetical protein